MKRVIAWFVRNPVAANLLMMLLLLGGGLSVTQLRQEEIPAIDLGTVVVTVPYLGAAPEEVETGVCIRIEETLEGLQGISRMESNLQRGEMHRGPHAAGLRRPRRGHRRSQDPGGFHQYVSQGDRAAGRAAAEGAGLGASDRHLRARGRAHAEGNRARRARRHRRDERHLAGSTCSTCAATKSPSRCRSRRCGATR